MPQKQYTTSQVSFGFTNSTPLLFRDFSKSSTHVSESSGNNGRSYGVASGANPLFALPSAVPEYAEYSQAARTGQHRLRRSSPDAPFPALQAVFIPWKSSSGRLSGQPATSDCSGNAGMVSGGDGFGWNGWILTGSGSGSA